MTEITSGQLRREMPTLLKRAAAGERFTVTLDGKPVACLVPLEPDRRWMPRDSFVTRILGHQADPGLSEDLRALSGSDADDPW